MRLGLLMRRMALDWTLSRRQRVDFGAPPQTWEQYSKEGRIEELFQNLFLTGFKLVSETRKKLA